MAHRNDRAMNLKTPTTAISRSRDDVLRDIAAALQQARLDEAISLAGELTAGSSADPAGLLMVAEYLSKTGHHDRTIAVLSPHRESFGEVPQFQWELGRALFETGRLADAMPLLSELVQRKPHWHHAQFALGYALHRAGAHAQSLPHLQEAVRLSPQHFESNLILSSALAGIGDYEQALAYARAANGLRPASEEAQEHLAGLERLRGTEKVSAALQRNDITAAVAAAAALVTAEEANAAGFLLVADFLTKQKRYVEIVTFLAPHMDAIGENAPLHLNLAAAYFNTRQRAKAETHFRVAVRLKPHWGQAQYSLGHILASAGRHAEAIPFLQEAARLLPQDFMAISHLVAALSVVGKYTDALDAARRALQMKPDDLGLQATIMELEQLAAAPPPKMAFNRWPDAAKDFADVRHIIDDYVVKNIPTAGIKLRRGMGVFTQGSCFARNLAYSLRRYDLRVENMTCGEEHNSTFANRAVADWLRDGVCDERTEIVANNVGAESRERYLAALRETDLFVYTMGLAAAHFDRKTGAFVMSRSTETNKAALFRRCDFRTTSVQDNVDNLLYILSVIRELAPKAAMVLTVSPVPLMVATEFHSAIVADCISKSTLRIAVHEVVAKRLPRVIYWPSFEMVRWVGGHTDSVYGADDGSSHHVNHAMIDHIMDSFINVFGDADLRATLKA